MKKINVFVIICFLPLLLFGQVNINCECDLLDKIEGQIIQKLDAADFKTATVLLSKYNTLETNNCKAKYYLLQLKIDFASQNVENFEAHLKLTNQYFSKINCPELELELLKLAANYYNASANYVKLLENETKLLNVFEKQKNKSGVANALTNISSTFNRLNNPKKGILYAKKAVLLSRQLPDSLSKALILNKIAASYLWYGQDFNSNKHLDSAKYFANNALKIAKNYKANTPQIGALIRLNAIAQEQKQYQLAIKYLQEATTLCKLDNDVTKLASIYSDKANVYKLLKKYDLAKVFADSSLYLNKKINYPPLIANAYQIIYDIEQLRGNYKNALEAFKKEKEITDSLTSSKKNAQVAEIEQKYNKVQNEKIISTLSQEKKISSLQLRLLGTIAVLIIIASILGYLIFRQKVLKQKHHLLEAEQRLNRSRINPHFFFNALSSIQGLALTNNDGKNLAIQIASFSKIMRKTLESTYTEYIDLNSETDYLKEYLSLHLLNNPEKFNYTINNNGFDGNEFLIPVMILQPFVENVMEHSFSTINYKGELKINFIKEEKELIITINDNGGGFVEKPKTHVSRATQITKDRLLLLNKEQKTNARFKTETSKTGTIVTLFLPLILNNENISN